MLPSSFIAWSSSSCFNSTDHHPHLKKAHIICSHRWWSWRQTRRRTRCSWRCLPQGCRTYYTCLGLQRSWWCLQSQRGCECCHWHPSCYLSHCSETPLNTTDFDTSCGCCWEGRVIMVWVGTKSKTEMGYQARGLYCSYIGYSGRSTWNRLRILVTREWIPQNYQWNYLHYLPILQISCYYRKPPSGFGWWDNRHLFLQFIRNGAFSKLYYFLTSSFLANFDTCWGLTWSGKV